MITSVVDGRLFRGFIWPISGAGGVIDLWWVLAEEQHRGMLRITKVRRCDQIAGVLRDRIRQGVYKPDTYLPGERELAVEVGCGRRTLGQALAQLSREGIVLRTLGRGTRVLLRDDAAIQGTLAVVYASAHCGIPREVMSILEGIRHVLSSVSVRHADVTVSSRGYPKSRRNPETISIEALSSIASDYEGLIFSELWGMEEQILALQEQGVPVSVANIETSAKLLGTYVDHYKIMRRATELLLAMGHRRIGFFGSRPERLFYGRAKDGYCAALKEAGLEIDEALIVLTERYQPREAYRLMQDFWGGASHPTGIVAARSFFGEAACDAAMETGLQLGRDISVVAYDDVSWQGREPYLTTFAEPCFEMGAVAAEMLIARIRAGGGEPERREIHAPLVLRRTAGPPASSDGVEQASPNEFVVMPVTTGEPMPDNPAGTR